jgi:hypothetical protein
MIARRTPGEGGNEEERKPSMARAGRWRRGSSSGLGTPNAVHGNAPLEDATFTKDLHGNMGEPRCAQADEGLGAVYLG